MNLQVVLNKCAYIVAVSGGVDSVSLLHLLNSSNHSKGAKLIVAHVDHNIRQSSESDAKFVKRLAEHYGLIFEKTKLSGKYHDEASLRRLRYEFLERLALKYDAEIVTAHHQDDVLETAILNLLRGTGVAGLASLRSDQRVIRPLLGYSKKQIIDYALQNNLKWREDPTNLDTEYLRNYVRLKLMPKLTEKRRELLSLIANSAVLSDQIDEIMTECCGFIFDDTGAIIRSRTAWFTYAQLNYIMRHILLRCGVAEPDRKMIERSVIAIKTLPAGKKINLDGSHWLVSKTASLQIISS
ncbi:tRNA lysidine(34) synthetase TilS [Candidatus Saccharibacteria bacterium]|jgi:tRNA(Ile)-lysidine synthase|nr:MAG: tRNA lysidine(34) synthetase TilS [Candidatus Saccharibacteria bacterium]